MNNLSRFKKAIRIACFIVIVGLISPISYGYGAELPPSKARQIRTDTTNFGTNLSVADTDVQKALDTIDNLVLGGAETDPLSLHLDLANDNLITGLELNLNSADLVTKGDILVYDPAGTDYISLNHDGTDGIIGTNTGAIDFIPGTVAADAACLNMYFTALTANGLYLDGATTDYTGAGVPITLNLTRDYKRAAGITNSAGIQNYLNIIHTAGTMSGLDVAYGIINRIDNDATISNAANVSRAYQEYGEYAWIDSLLRIDSAGDGAVGYIAEGIKSIVNVAPIYTDSHGTTPASYLNAKGLNIDIDTTPTLTSGALTTTASGVYIDMLDGGAGTSTGYGLYINAVAGYDTKWGIYDVSGENWYCSGNVGIGTTSPSHQLTVSGNSTGADAEWAAFPSIRILNQSVATHSFAGFRFDANNGTVGGGLFADGLGTSSGIAGSGAGNAGFIVQTRTNHLLAFGTNDTERMRISAAGGLSIGGTYVTTDPGVNNVIIQGNVGIGTTVPYSLLDASSITGGVLTISRNDATLTAANTIGTINFWTNDTQTTTNPLAAQIIVTAKNTPATDINPGVMKFYTTPTGVAAALTLALTIDEAQLATFSSGATVSGTTTVGTLAGTIDAGGATSLEVPNAAGNVAVAAGQVAIDTTNKQLAWNDGARESAIPSIHTAQGDFDLAGAWDTGPATHIIHLVDLDAATYPNGIYITSVTVDCSAEDPTTELTGDLKYCDATTGAFPGANAAVIQALDSTTGNMTNAAVNTSVATGKSIYILMDADPTDANQTWHIKFSYYIEED